MSTWHIDKVETVNQSGIGEIVRAIHWRLRDDAGNSVTGVIDPIYLNGIEFKPFNQVTEDDLIFWARQALGGHVAGAEIGLENAAKAASFQPETRNTKLYSGAK